MSIDRAESIDQISNDLDEIITAVEELEADLPADAESKRLYELKHALRKAKKIADEIEDDEE